MFSYWREEKMKQFDKIFWINSKNRPDRFNNMKKRLTELGINAERFEAIHGGEINWTLPEYGIFYIDKIKKTLNNAEIGCFLSHRAIYEKIKKEGWKKTLILEDDALFGGDFIETLNELYDCCLGYDMLYLGQWNYDKEVVQGEKSALKKLILTVKNRSVYKAERCWLTHAYAVDLSIIDMLLSQTKNLYGSIDNVLADIQENNKLKVYAIHPALINQDGTRSSLRD
jgi:glycosyl transferase, family 25